MLIKVVKKSILDVKADVIVVNLFEGVKYPGGVTGIVDDAFDNVISEYVIKKEKSSRAQQPAWFFMNIYYVMDISLQKSFPDLKCFWGQRHF